MPSNDLLSTETDSDYLLSEESALMARLQAPAPTRAISAYRQGDYKRGWIAWRKYLVDRHSRYNSSGLFAGKQSSLLWCVPDELSGSDTADFVDQCYAVAKKKESPDEVCEQITAWLAEATGAEFNLSMAIECLAWAQVLPTLADKSTASDWWELLDQLVTYASGGLQNETPANPLARIVMSGELTVTLAVQFPEVKACESLTTRAMKFLSQSIIDMTDGEGMLHARDWGMLRPLLASLARCQLMTSSKCFNKQSQNQYEWLITQALRLSRADGRQSLTVGSEGQWCKRLFAAVIQLGADEADLEVADRILPGRKKSPFSGIKWPSASYQSEWSESAVMRGKWSRKSPHLAIAYHDAKTQLELSIGKDVVFSGEWGFDLACGDQRIVGRNEWEQICWESDADVDFLELEMKLAPDLKIERSVLLARDEQFVLLADAVIGSEDAALAYKMNLPLAGTVSARSEDETHEVTLCGDEATARVLPVALPEWRSDSRWGRLELHSDELILSQLGQQSLFAPLFIDFSRRRASKELTWRNLSVGEMRQNLPRSVASGHRVQIGKRQWLIYRRLGMAGNRTILGQNLISEFLVARFLPSGEIEELLQIE
jgi:hypothetical protein